MKQVLMRKGQVLTAEVPAPQIQPGYARVTLRASCISPGTELMGLAGSGKSLLQRAREQPDKALAAIERMRKVGPAAVLRQAQDKFDAETGCGYSAAGLVSALGEGMGHLRLGQPVAITGAGYAMHAEEVVVPRNLIVPIPKGVTFSSAATVALGAIALQGVRRADVRIGERVAVIGCGAIGLLTVQILKAAGCRVIGLDLDQGRLALAQELGAERVISAAEPDAAQLVVHHCDGRGVDAVLLTVATDSNAPLSQAFRMCRRKGRVVLVGIIGREFSRDEMYAKELDFLVSTSYGPGRYDEDYERHGQDYPYGYVRWTEQRNMDAYLQLVAAGAVTPEALIGKQFPVSDADQAYAALKTPPQPLLVTLTYPTNAKEESESTPTLTVAAESIAPWVPPRTLPIGIGLIGAGSFIQSTHIPNLRSLTDQYRVRMIADQSGVTARGMAKCFPECAATTDIQELLRSDQIHMVLIGTRHDTHANLACQALRAGKAVLVEKPMCLAPAEFETLRQVLKTTTAPFLVGYNRRFSACAQTIKAALGKRVNPAMLQYTMNAGYIPYDHWTQTAEGGGRILGEACHIIDLFQYLLAAPVESVSVTELTPHTGSVQAGDNRVITLQFAEGSVASLLYTAVGQSAAGKERLEAHFDQKTIILDDYQTIHAYGLRLGTPKPQRHDPKGHRAELLTFATALIAGQRFPIPLAELEATWQTTWMAAQPQRSDG